jgi:hypothetical protein
MHLCKLRFAAFELPKYTFAAVALVEGVVSRDSSRSSVLSIRARTGLRCTENSTSFRKILARRSLLAVSVRDL